MVLLVEMGGYRKVNSPVDCIPGVINGRIDLPVPAHFNQENHTLEDLKVAVLRAGLANQQYRKKQEMQFIFKYGTVSPSGMNQDFSFA